MSLSELPPLPPTLRQVEHYLRTALLYERTNIVICYWNLYLGVQEGMKLDRTSSAAHNFLASALTLLEKMKEDNPKNDALTNQAAAKSHIEAEADRMYKYAHSQELAGASDVELVDLTAQVENVKAVGQWRSSHRSALDYDDAKTSIENMCRAIELLQKR
uniref:Vta1/callose synthase N-terminal domain-containing protein n=1 Tax=Ditylenchus dipsaci TaxID=166011 RepID=A0A915E5G6_9BILA